MARPLAPPPLLVARPLVEELFFFCGFPNEYSIITFLTASQIRPWDWNLWHLYLRRYRIIQRGRSRNSTLAWYLILEVLLNYNIILKNVIKLVRPMTIQRGRSRNSKLAWYCILEVRSNYNNTIPTGKTHHIFLGSWLIKYFFFSLKDRKNIVLKKVNLEAETWIKKIIAAPNFFDFR